MIFHLTTLLTQHRDIQKVKKINTSFLWFQIQDNKRDHFDSWGIVCKSENEGVLGLGNLGAKNKLLEGKWLWNFPRKEIPFRVG